MKLLIKGVKLVNPEQKLNEEADLLIADGKIEKLGSIDEKSEPFDEVIELNNCICSPGFFDMHVHLREPGREDEETIESGSRAAAAGGFTGIAAMPNTSPTADSAEIVRYILEKAKGSLTTVYPIGAVTKERKGESIAPILELADAGAVGFSDDGVAVKTSAVLRKGMEYIKMLNAPIIEHCEDEHLATGAMNEGVISTQLGLPPLASVSEDLIVMRDILMADYVGCKLHIAHISTKGAVELVRQAKAKGQKVTSEVTPHHFSLIDEAVRGYDTNFKMNPPLRTQGDVDAILEGLRDGTIDCIASDHAPHSIEEKDEEFIYAPNGILGLETQLGVALTELYHKKILSLEEIIEKFAINPRKILSLPVPKIAVGEFANLTIFDTEMIWTVDVNSFYSKSRNSPFDKRLLTGKAVAVINSSQLFYADEFRAI